MSSNFIALIACVVAFGVILWAICRSFTDTVDKDCPLDQKKYEKKE